MIYHASMAEISYHSTRSGAKAPDCSLPFSRALVQGIAGDGGLFVPSSFPRIDIGDSGLWGLSYQELAERILTPFLSGFSGEEIRTCISSAYSDDFRSSEIAPVHSCGSSHFIELYHGKTLAFKDMALSILPHFLQTAVKSLAIEDRIVILTATSGDTGKAALEGFAGVEGTEIIVFYPDKGVSEVQKRQMTTQLGENTHVCAIEGNFDDAQSGVKALFADPELRELLSHRGYRFSSANSINIGRLLPQIVYYFSSYFRLIREKKLQPGEKINVVVPTGNFGNILAARYAGEMGLPVGRYICASNQNNVLTDFFRSGTYDLNRPFSTTISPSMDILISSNLERFLYEISGRDSAATASLMEQLKRDGSYTINRSMREHMENFYGGCADDQATVETIGTLYRDYGYLVDTHTAVAYRVLEEYRRSSGDERQALIASTASPFKFSRSVCRGIGIETEGLDDFALNHLLAKQCGQALPEPIVDLEQRAVRHKLHVDKDGMKSLVQELLP